VPDHQDVLAVAIPIQQLFQILESGFRSEAVGLQDPELVSALWGDKSCCLKAALERASDDDIKTYLHRVQDLRQLQAVANAFLVERALPVYLRVCGAGAGAGVAKDE
jgi:hypothetical protein